MFPVDQSVVNQYNGLVPFYYPFITYPFIFGLLLGTGQKVY